MKLTTWEAWQLNPAVRRSDAVPVSRTVFNRLREELQEADSAKGDRVVERDLELLHTPPPTSAERRRIGRLLGGRPVVRAVAFMSVGPPSGRCPNCGSVPDYWLDDECSSCGYVFDVG